MTDVLENGIKLPQKGSRDWYTEASDNAHLIDNHLGDTDKHLSSDDREAIASIGTKATPQDILDAIALLVDNAPETLNTLGKIASELGNKQPTLTAQQLANIADVPNKAKATDLTTHTSNADIHVTTADKAKWDDVVNKANDNDVVHKSGNETIRDLKTFGRIGEEGGQIDLEKSTSSLLTSNISIDSLDESLRFIAKDSNGIYATFFINFQNRHIYCDRECTLGTISNKLRDVNTKAINGLNPGALSLPQSSFTDDLSNNLVYNGYNSSYIFSMPYDGWVYLYCRTSVATDAYPFLLRNSTTGIANTTRETLSGIYVPAQKNDNIEVFCPKNYENQGTLLRLFKSTGNV